MDNLRQLINEAKCGGDAAMVEILEQFMWLIDEHSYINGMLNEDCKHAIIEAVISAVRRYRG